MSSNYEGHTFPRDVMVDSSGPTRVNHRPPPDLASRRRKPVPSYPRPNTKQQESSRTQAFTPYPSYRLHDVVEMSELSGTTVGQEANVRQVARAAFFGGSPTIPDTESAHGSGSTSLTLDMDQTQSQPINEKRRSLYPPTAYAFNPQPRQKGLPQPTRKRSPPPQPVKPSYLRLFVGITPRRDLFFLLLPAVLASLAAAAVQPFMTIVVGATFSAIANYPRDPKLATPEMKQTLMKQVGFQCLQLTLAGFFSLTSEYAKAVWWFRFSESTVANLRAMVFDGVQKKPMEWFDTGMGMADDEHGALDSVGAGGLMAKFARETDDIRIATAVPLGNALRDLLAFVVCVLLALVKAPVLAVVTLAAVPVLILVNAVTQVIVQPWYAVERRAFAEASTEVERVSMAISTVKAFNAQQTEVDRFRRLVNNGTHSLVRQAWIWATCYGLSDFLLLSMFVVGFWFGARLVEQGKSDVGTVITVFWACLLGSSNLQRVVPMFATLTKGKLSLASLLTVIGYTENRQSSSAQEPDWLPLRCHGGFDLRNVSFEYPSRPDVQVLQDVTLFLPPGEMTFIVGGSGSGKSTISQLLLRLYEPSAGEIELDDRNLTSLPRSFTCQHIASVDQGCILFEMSVHDNVALGLVGAGPNSFGMVRKPSDVTRQEVIEACKMAQIHDFIISLPQGYETKLGASGSQLSGGQKQRLAIARARIRDPTVLILDEATSALDATARVVVFEALRRWRKNRTTIVITHDLSQITHQDFVYVMKDGVVAEQGFRMDLMPRPGRGPLSLGVFAALAAEQAIEPLPAKEVRPWKHAPQSPDIDGEGPDGGDPRLRRRRSFRASMVGATGGPLNVRSSFMASAFFDSPDEAKRAWEMQLQSSQMQDPGRALADTKSQTPGGDEDSPLNGAQPEVASPPRPPRNPLRLSKTAQLQPLTRAQKHLSWSSYDLGNGPFHSAVDLRLSFDDCDDLKQQPSAPTPFTANEKEIGPQMTMAGMLVKYWHTIPHKPQFFVGIFGAVIHGITTPLWSFFIAKLMAMVGAGQAREVSIQGAMLIGICFVQGCANFVSEAALLGLGAKWTAMMRMTAFDKVLLQDKAWFDVGSHSPSRLVQGLIKDVEDIRHLVSTVLPRFSVAVVMLTTGLVWAIVTGWQLTLVGLALGPFFAVTIFMIEATMARAEEDNKFYRDSVGRIFYESIANIRGIRAMTLDSSFRERFALETIAAKKSGYRGAWWVSIGLALNGGLPLMIQALLNYVGALFIRQGTMSYSTMLQVYSLVLFSLTFGMSLLGFMPLLAKAKMAGRDFYYLLRLTANVKESVGDLRDVVTGEVLFSNVSFSYPTRPDVPVLKNLFLHLSPGEVIAIVGPSGCGKSTIAALLQRLYTPTGGSISLNGRYDLSQTDVRWLRDHIAVVSQTANLFDASVAENVAYGASAPVPHHEIVQACKAANIHDFIESLPEGYETNLGENAALISGGQAQRLQIARALVRRSSILILDECTSALDVENQRAVIDTIVKVKESRTTIFITHSLEAMRRCERIICLGDGKVAEDGTYNELIAKGGVFAELMRTGEWD